MATLKPFLNAGFLHQLERCVAGDDHPTSWPAALRKILLIDDEDAQPAPAASHLIHLLHARMSVLQAAFNTEQVANELRRYQKFAKPGQPSPHIVQLRRQQAAARQASSQSLQSLVKHATAFMRAATIELPAKMALEPFINQWLDASLPKEVAQ
ncbi:MAG: hypothetical protein ABI114_05770 [Rhodanobacter sp.]